MGEGAGLGGLLFVCIVVVGPVALIAHLHSRRYAMVSLMIPTAVSAVLGGLWLLFNVLDPASGDRKWHDLLIIRHGFVFSFIVTLLAGIPSLMVQLMLRIAPPPSDTDRRE